MKRKDLVGGIIKSIWTDDDTDNIIVIVETDKHGMQGFESVSFELIQEDEYDDE